MIVIGISGYIQTEWIALEHGEVLQHVYTKGIVPFLQSRREISRIVRLELPSFFFENKIKQVFFYGIACNVPENKRLIESALVAHFKSPIYVDHIMLGSARAVFQDEPGITCVINTSSATCLYDGETITKFGFNGGYILGDVGSSSELARLFISDIIKGFVPKKLAEEYKKHFDTNLSGLIGTLYNGPAFEALDETAKFLFEHSDNDYVSQLIKTNFENFINGNLGNYDELKNQKIRVVGDFAYRFKEILQKAMNEKKIEVDKIIGSAMDGLQEYHINHPIY